MVDWLVVGAVSGLGPARIKQLLNDMTVSELRERLEHRDKDALFLHGRRLKGSYTLDLARVDAALNWLDSSADHHIICQSAPLYPSLLREITDPPVILFVKGDLNTLLYPTIALVGSRAASSNGSTISYQLSKELSGCKVAICSGMAVGIDGAAHQGAIDGAGKTIAVLGSGVDVIYPKCHQSLYHKILQQGCIVSEFWPDARPFAGNFPKRNRIISGLSLGVVVVEALKKSGSLITARLAMEQGREVFAVPGNILAGDHQGCHFLIKDGAKLIENAADVIAELGSLTHFHLEELLNRHYIGEEEIACDLPFASLLASVGYEATHLDVVVEHSGKTIELVLEQLLELELQGWVLAVPGGYIRTKRS